VGVAGDLSGFSDFELKLLVDDLLEQLPAASGRRRELLLEQLADMRDELERRVA
jgi:hypothetical protein